MLKVVRMVSIMLKVVRMVSIMLKMVSIMIKMAKWRQNIKGVGGLQRDNLHYSF